MRKLAFLIVVSLAVITPFKAAAQSAAEPLDKFGDINCEDEKARLDNLAVMLQNQPDAKGYVVFYGGRRLSSRNGSRLPRHGEAEARVARMKDYLVSTRGVNSDRVVFINGGYRETWAAELWIMSKDAGAPPLTPTLKPAQIKFRKGRAKARDYHCEV